MACTGWCRRTTCDLRGGIAHEQALAGRSRPEAPDWLMLRGRNGDAGRRRLTECFICTAAVSFHSQVRTAAACSTSSSEPWQMRFARARSLRTSGMCRLLRLLHSEVHSFRIEPRSFTRRYCILSNAGLGPPSPNSHRPRMMTRVPSRTQSPRQLWRQRQSLPSRSSRSRTR
jgi:hypothetical protein